MALRAPRGRDSIEDREGPMLPRAFCPEGHMHRKSRALASLLLSPGLPSPPPLLPSLPCSTSVSPTETPRYTSLSPERGSTSSSSDPKRVSIHSSPVCDLLLQSRKLRQRDAKDWLSGARPSPGSAPDKDWTVAFTLGRKEPSADQGQSRCLVR